MIEQICKCQKCSLYLNQKPLLDVEKKCQIFWIGLSAKKILCDTEVPLSPETNSGMLIHKIEEECKSVVSYKTNLVKCLPLTKQNKLRYPNKKEIDLCFEHLITEINAMSPKIVFLLGKRVYSSVEEHLGIRLKKWDGFKYFYTEHERIYYVPVQHPSYIYVYKRKEIKRYIEGILEIINQLL